MAACSAYPPELSARMERGDPQAQAFAERMGIALAGTLATLKLAPPESRAARIEWPTEHWEKWTQVQKLVLGGGVLSGELGRVIVDTAREWLPRLGVADLQLNLFPQPRELMLHGIARQFENGPVVTLDAGHTAIKRAYAEVSGGEVVSFAPMPLLPLPTDCRTAEALLDFLVSALLETVPTGQKVAQFGLSLSVHLDEAGNIDPDSAAGSFWGQLHGLNLVADIESALQQHLVYACTVKVLHEGQAAVHGLPDMDASILLGTSVGGALKAE
ncbi:hypothetical protein ACFP81_01200 [Deinococcus lacus]|uniref:Uncharacterized protein n=1 Tax=Deinococcus lacus TaxID=392561 RepID=A0ABW1YBF4_9DEIO